MALCSIIGGSYAMTIHQKNEQAAMCLAENIYHEARGESVDAKYILGILTIARVSDPDPRWPKTICGVVAQDHQFSWTLDYSLATTRSETKQWEEAQKISRDLLENVWTKYRLPVGWECARFYHRSDNTGVSKRSKRDSDAHLFPVGTFDKHTAFQERHGCKAHLPTTL